MSGVKHTPGPWTSSGVYIDSDFGMVGHANFSADLLSGCPKANARLIAAAPDLLEALEVLVAHTDGLALPTTAQAARLKALAALSKATAQQEGR